MLPLPLFLFVTLVFLCTALPVQGATFHRIETPWAEFLFSPGLEPVIEDLTVSYRSAASELEDALGWRLDYLPTVVLVKEGETFRDMTGSDWFAAFAVPKRRMMVLDYSKMNTRPLSLAATLKHELCHLLLHRYIPEDRLPRWLNEGIAQWSSDGLSELLLTGQGDVLRATVLAGSPPVLDGLDRHFHRDRRSLVLAYEASKSAIEFMVREYGTAGVLSLLNRLRSGDSLESAFENALSVSIGQYEDQWHRHLRKSGTWLVFLTVHIYEFVFIAAALATVYGFIRAKARRRRRYEALEDDDPGEEAEEEAESNDITSASGP